ncbi:MAG: hypothetical protein WA821_00055, partial [Anaerolineales bacterium]
AAGHLYGQTSADDEYIRQAWGYNPGGMGYYYLNGVCSLRGAFSQLVERLEPAQFAQAPDQLKQAGVAVRSATELDLKATGRTNGFC